MSKLSDYSICVQELASFATQATDGTSSNYYLKHFGEIINGSMQIGTADGNSVSIENGIQRIINTIVSFVTSNESSQADKEVEDTKKKLTRAEKRAQKSAEKMNNDISELGGQIDTQNKIITDATADLDERKKEMDKEQKAIQETIQKINDLQNQLAKSTDSNNQLCILSQIESLSTELGARVSSISALQASVEDLSTQVENAYTEIETAKGYVVEVQSDGQLAINESQADFSGATAEIEQSTAKGTQNIANGTTLNAAAAAASSIVLTAAQAPQLYKAAADQTSAGTKRATGAVSSIIKLQQGIGSLQNCDSLMQTFNTQIGGLLTAFSGLIGTWNEAITPMITSLGSYDGLCEQQEALDAAVVNDKSTLSDQTYTNSTDNRYKGINPYVSSSQENDYYNVDSQSYESTIGTKAAGTKANGEKPYELETPYVKIGLNVA